MRADEIRDIVENFKRSEYNKILITGEWGIGKSHYMWELMREQKITRMRFFATPHY